MEEDSNINRMALEHYVRTIKDTLPMCSCMGRWLGKYAVECENYELAELVLGEYAVWSLQHGHLCVMHERYPEYFWMVRVGKRQDTIPDLHLPAFRQIARVKFRTERIEEWEYINRDISALIQKDLIEIVSAKCMNIITFKVNGDYEYIPKSTDEEIQR